MTYYKAKDLLTRSVAETDVYGAPGIVDGSATLPIAATTTPVATGVEMEVDWQGQTHSSPADPKVWGPALWLVLHTGSAHYPKNASPIYRERMKGFILGIPYIIPCEVCADHARTYIREKWGQIEQIVAGQDALFEFFCDFHNKVNKRYQKPIVDCKDIKTLYTRPVRLKKMSYKRKETPS